MLNLSGEPYKIEHLYYLAPLDNLASIVNRGLLSHNRAHREGHLATDISLLTVNDRRGQKEAYGRVLHDYVPLYFNPKNPMLYRRQGEYDIAIVLLDSGLLFQNGTVFTDGNAASGATSFFNDIKEIDKLDWQCIRADWYRDLPDGIRRRCAEVLVPDTIHPRFIKQVAVRTQETLLALDENIKRRTEIVVRPELYF